MPTPPNHILKQAADAAPALGAAALTPADGADLAVIPTRALWVGVLGDVKVTTAQGDAVTFVGVQGLLPVQVTRVWNTGTSAASIVALY